MRELIERLANELIVQAGMAGIDLDDPGQVTAYVQGHCIESQIAGILAESAE